MAECQGKFKLASSDGFDEYMKVMGVGMVMRKLGATATPSTEISETDGTWTIKTTTTFKNTEIKFKLGEEFEETTIDGRVVKATITKEGNKLIHSQKGDKEKGEKNSVIIREFVGDEMKMVLTAEDSDITCTRIYKKSD